MIASVQDLVTIGEQLPEGAHLILPETIEVERPGESLGHIYKTPKGLMAYRSYS